jgi:hypothetical protein
LSEVTYSDASSNVLSQVEMGNRGMRPRLILLIYIQCVSINIKISISKERTENFAASAKGIHVVASDMLRDW